MHILVYIFADVSHGLGLIGSYLSQALNGPEFPDSVLFNT